jgi:hypothetical protein
MLTHLRNRGGALDFADTKTLLAEQDREEDTSKVPQLYFNRIEKAIQGLTCAGINSDLNKRRDIALYFPKVSGKFDAAVREWEQKTTAQKTWANVKTFILLEYAKENKQNKLSAKKFRVNNIDEQAKATEELIAALTKNHTRQMKTQIKSTTNAMRKMISLIEKKQPTSSQQLASSQQTIQQ